MLFAKESALELSPTPTSRDFRHEIEINQRSPTRPETSASSTSNVSISSSAALSPTQANAEIAISCRPPISCRPFIGGDSPSATFDITGDIIPPLVAQTREDLIRTALATRPDLQAATAAVLAAEATSRLAIANGTADPTVEGEYDRSGTYNSAGFNVNIPLRLFDRNQGNKETARLETDFARISVAATRNQVVSDVDQAWVGYTRAKTLSDRFTTHFLDESTDVLSISRFAYDHGGLALIDYLDALRDARTATSNALTAYTNTWLAIHQLSAASASDLTP